ncbi:MAG TPA: CDP-alcohol phosphatidyltransferase family protein [Gammaproteobacteria bacterium]|nr:CDP-alcohol phosphatidyltransferase family protein [Gammaproteobacteria bacterium]
MANLITLSRLILLVLVVWISYQPVGAWQFASFFLIILIFVTDGLDGYIARKRNETSLFGALFDIAGDRVVELTLWVVAADLDLVPIAVPLVFIIRGVVVDTIRSSNSVSRGVSPFALMQSPLGKFLVAGKFMRILYAVIKACAFCGLSLLRPFPAALPGIWAYVGTPLTVLTYFLVYFSVLLCLLRGLPVILEFVHDQKEHILGGTEPKP